LTNELQVGLTATSVSLLVGQLKEGLVAQFGTNELRRQPHARLALLVAGIGEANHQNVAQLIDGDVVPLFEQRNDRIAKRHHIELMQKEWMIVWGRGKRLG
jgi:hypothetical protein